MSESDIVIGQLYKNPKAIGATYLGTGHRDLHGNVSDQQLVVIMSEELTAIGCKVVPSIKNLSFWGAFEPVF